MNRPEVCPINVDDCTLCGFRKEEECNYKGVLDIEERKMRIKRGEMKAQAEVSITIVANPIIEGNPDNPDDIEDDEFITRAKKVLVKRGMPLSVVTYLFEKYEPEVDDVHEPDEEEG